eukprot:SAG11_NODE_2320_length_3524_cov_71.912993_2_plen_280_part_00
MVERAAALLKLNPALCEGVHVRAMLRGPPHDWVHADFLHPKPPFTESERWATVLLELGAERAPEDDHEDGDQLLGGETCFPISGSAPRRVSPLGLQPTASRQWPLLPLLIVRLRAIVHRAPDEQLNAEVNDYAAALEQPEEELRTKLAAMHHRNCNPKAEPGEQKLLVEPTKGSAVFFYNLRPPITSQGEETVVPEFTALYQSCVSSYALSEHSPHHVISSPSISVVFCRGCFALVLLCAVLAHVPCVQAVRRAVKWEAVLWFDTKPPVEGEPNYVDLE